MSASGQGGKAAAKAHNVKSMLSHMISDASISAEEKAEQISQNVSKTTLFRKKAMDTKKMRDTFKFFDSIAALVTYCGGPKHVAKGSWQRSNPTTWASIISSLFSYILMMAYHKQQEKGANWSYIFFRYMASGEGKVNNILTTEKVKSYYLLMSHLLDEIPSEMKLQAEEICQFFEQHSVDPYSAVVGQMVNKEVLRAAAEVTDDMTAALCTKDPFNYVLMQGSKKKKRSEKVKYQELVKLVTMWSKLDSSEDRRRELKHFVSILRGIHLLPAGSLVIVKMKVEDTDELEWRYARVAGKPVGKLALVYCSPTENTMTSVPFDRVLPITDSMLQEYFETPAVMEMERCVELMGDRELWKIMNHCKKRMLQLLEEMDISIEVVQLGKKAQCSLAHLTTLYEIAEKLKSDLPEAVVKEVEDYTVNELKSCVARMDTGPEWEVFQPTKEIRQEQLLEFEVKAALVSEYRQYVGACNMAIEEMESYRAKIMNGKRKTELSVWWLQLVTTRVKEYLSCSGFEHDAIPDNYLDCPPADTAIVRKNLILLGRILKSGQSGHDHFKLKVLIKDICNKIYPKITHFMADLKICILQMLELDELDKFVFKDVKSAIKKLPKGKVKHQLRGMMKDLSYLVDMQEIEGEAGFMTKARMDVIPISGLIVSKLCRLENEARTVLDLWEPVVYTRDDEDARTPLENAVIKRDLKAIDNMVKGGLCDLNEVDGNGWTCLHLACSFCFHEARLDVVNRLLKYDEMDVMCANNYRNLALHYLSRMPQVDVDPKQFVQAMEAMLGREPMALYCQNSSGETPLHTAALAANITAVEILLNNGADPNAQTGVSESVLHYAVKSASAACTEVVLSYGGDKNLVDEKYFSVRSAVTAHLADDRSGDSPLDWAHKLNLEDVVKVLMETSPNYDARTLAAKNKTKREEFIATMSASELRTLWKKPQTAVDEIEHVMQEFGTSDISVGTPASWNKAPVPNAIMQAIQEKESNEAEIPAAQRRSKAASAYIVQGAATDLHRLALEKAAAAPQPPAAAAPQPPASASKPPASKPPAPVSDAASRPKKSSEGGSKRSSTLRTLKSLTKKKAAPALVPRGKKKSAAAAAELPPVATKKSVLSEIEASVSMSSAQTQSSIGTLGALGASVSDLAKKRQERVLSAEVAPSPVEDSPASEAPGRAASAAPSGRQPEIFESGKIYCRALFDHEPEEDDELEFFAGDIVTVLDNEDAEGWWVGSIAGNTGNFPYNYVELYTPPTKPPVPAKPKLPPKPSAAVVAAATASLDPATPVSPSRSPVVSPRSPRSSGPPVAARQSSGPGPQAARRPSAGPGPVAPRQGSGPVPQPALRTSTGSDSGAVAEAASPPARDSRVAPTPSARAPTVSNPPAVAGGGAPGRGPNMRRRGSLPPAPGQRERAIVACTFTGEDEGELSVPAGALLDVLKKDDDGWWTVRVEGTKETGLVPGSFLAAYEEPEEPAPGNPGAGAGQPMLRRGRPKSQMVRGGIRQGNPRPQSARMAPVSFDGRGRGRGLPRGGGSVRPSAQQLQQQGQRLQQGGRGAQAPPRGRGRGTLPQPPA